MWMVFALGSAVFAGVTSILAKCGIKKTSSDLATFMRTIVVLVFAWIMVFIKGSYIPLSSIQPSSWLALILSGLATGASWLAYFKALSLGPVSQVVAVDKSSLLLSIIWALLFFNEPFSWWTLVALGLLSLGTYLMVDVKKGDQAGPAKRWLLSALASAFFASSTSILAKIGMQDLDSTLGTAIRTGVVLIMSGLVVLLKKSKGIQQKANFKEMGFIVLSGLATGASWLCYYRALKDGLASVVVPIDKLSILVSVGFSWMFLKEPVSLRAVKGLFLIVLGTLLLVYR